MKTRIYEIGVIDKLGNKHPVKFKEGLNVITGKSSTGKSALIEIFDYCFGSSENTIPKGVITISAAIYYVALAVNGQDMIIARDPNLNKKAFFRRVDKFDSNDIQPNYFESNYFRNLDEFKKHLTSFFLDIYDVDVSLEARANRQYNRKAATPSIRSFTSFMLQHQNLIANKHALFYRFDQKEKRDQVIDHTKIFLGLVDQKYFLLSQERERIITELNRLKRLKESNKKASELHTQRVEPVLRQLYALMGFKEEPLSLSSILYNPQIAKDYLDQIITPEKIDYTSNSIVQHYDFLKKNRNLKIAELRKLQHEETALIKHIAEEVRFSENVSKFSSPKNVHISTTVCPFCHTQKEELKESAEKLKKAIIKVSDNLSQTRPMKAKFETSLIEVKRKIEIHTKDLSNLNTQINEVEKAEEKVAEQKSLYESILMEKAKLFILLDTLNLADDIELDKEIKTLDKQLFKINNDLKQYNIQNGLERAASKVNKYMAEIGEKFEFEGSYRPINLKFSFETFDLYHLDGNEKIYLRSMGSGANWLYSHVTLFLALHKYFTELGDKCSIPSILFLDQPTQVYFPNFKRDISETFSEQKKMEEQQRKNLEGERVVDEDIKAVENLFSQLSIYCDEIEKNNSFCPQIIVTDHADDLKLEDGFSFESLVNGNRWRKRGFIEPLPDKDLIKILEEI
ncbi:DUF3732 domain-containing protein [Acinetobacter baumannii]|uniref:DUF3732 domain-containing protein n=1 Tax=Acinetobacter baumannii TaxID=470 RepID=UPI00030F820F|nr:DUF3732 domain-containing protein [Acinetobacter baumannii]MDH2566352.1 DUF3732 domain-containing protein [Acinetobacter baumannii]